MQISAITNTANGKGTAGHHTEWMKRFWILWPGYHAVTAFAGLTRLSAHVLLFYCSAFIIGFMNIMQSLAAYYLGIILPGLCMVNFCMGLESR